MFPLSTKTFPATASELALLLNQSVKRLFSGAERPVSIRDDAYPQMAEIRITLDGAQLRANPPQPPAPTGSSLPAVQFRELLLNASGLSIGPASVDLRIGARDVRLNQARDTKGDIILLLQSAAHGEIEINAPKNELESAILALAKAEASKHGVTIDQVQLTFRTRGPRSLDGEVQLRARKLFFSTVIRVAAKLDLDDEMNAKLSGTRCNGEGAIGALVCSVLAPHLQKLDGRTFALMALPLGDIRLRDVRLSAGEQLKVTAEFAT